MNQPIQKNSTIAFDLPKLSNPYLANNYKSQINQVNTKKITNTEHDKRSMSPTKIKQFLKLFKQSNSNTQILKASPYCNSIFKNKLFNALRKQKQKILPYNKSDTKRVNDNNIVGLCRQSERHNQNSRKTLANFKNKQKNTHSHSYSQQFLKQGHTIEVRQTKSIKTLNYIHKLVIQFSNQQITLQVNDKLYEKQGYLSSIKILQFAKNSTCSNKLLSALNSSVGLTVVGLKGPKQTIKLSHYKSGKKQSNSSEQLNQKHKQNKKFLQATTYLLAYGQLNIKDEKYSIFQKIYLKPLIPKRINELLNEQRINFDNSIKNIYLCDFDIINCLGSGGFSTVFLVRCNLNNKYYAMKLIDKSFIVETQRDGIVENERFILQTLSSKVKDDKQSKKPSFVTQLSFCFETVNYFVFMLQYCPGGQLFNQLKKVRKMTEDQARFYFLQILIALDYIHSHNILYRDLKPQNLLIDSQGHIKIADFGLSKPLSSNKSFSYSFCGSPQYMAPQMLTKQGHNYLLDYYCLGALLYELVIGVPPYYSLKQQQIYQSILTQQLGFPNNVPLSNEIVNLLKGLLKKDAKHRLGSLCGIKQIMCHPWIGKIKRTSIQNRELTPPFIPNLSQSNFDADQIKANITQIMDKLRQDSKVRQFQTHFSDQFCFINPVQKLLIDKKSQFNKTKDYAINTTSRKNELKYNSLDGKIKQSNHSPYSFRNLLKQRNSLKKNNNISEFRIIQKMKKPASLQRNKGMHINLQKKTKNKKKPIIKRQFQSIR